MDNETQIMLEKLVDAVNKLNHPDLWIIILTAINIIAFILVACTQIYLQKQQHQLQKKQTSIQYYDKCKRLYQLIGDIHRSANFLIFQICGYLNDLSFNGAILDYFEHQKTNILSLCDQIDENATDIDLILPKEYVNRLDYAHLLQSMYFLVDSMRSYEQVGNLKQRGSIKYSADFLDNAAMIEYILLYVKEEDKSNFKKMLTHIAEETKRVCKKETMQKIREMNNISF